MVPDCSIVSNAGAGPVVVSAGGGVVDATDKLFPAPIGRNGRQFQRQHRNRVQVTYRQQIVTEFASRNCAYMGAIGVQR